MNRTRLASYYGIRKPYNFRVAVPFIFAVSALLAVLLLVIYLFATGGLRIGTERFYFLLYILTLLATALVISRILVASLAILLWCAVELSLATSSAALTHYGYGDAALVPSDFFTPPSDDRFSYHSMLRLVPKPRARQAIRFDKRNMNVRVDSHVNWEQLEGRELKFIHNSLGLRGSELTNTELQKDLVFVYGGSTTYDWTVTQGSTWVELLQSRLGGKFTLVNFGVPVHTTTEHLIYTAFYQGIVGKQPVCAVYYVGFNDLLNSYIENLDPTYENFLGLAMTVRKPEIAAAKYSPALRLAYRAITRRVDSVPPSPGRRDAKPRLSVDKNALGFFIQHVTAISAINHKRGIRTIFIGQMINREELSKPGGTPFGAFLNTADIWPLQNQFNYALKAKATALGDDYIDPGIENFVNEDFTDQVHFSATGSNKFSIIVSAEVAKYCQ